jgi:hypothetical protein
MAVIFNYRGINTHQKQKIGKPLKIITLMLLIMIAMQAQAQAEINNLVPEPEGKSLGEVRRDRLAQLRIEFKRMADGMCRLEQLKANAGYARELIQKLTDAESIDEINRVETIWPH